MPATQVLTTLATSFEGDIVVSMLKSAGISAALRAACLSLGAAEMGPVDVLVPASQLADARELLAQAEQRYESK